MSGDRPSAKVRDYKYGRGGHYVRTANGGTISVRGIHDVDRIEGRVDDLVAEVDRLRTALTNVLEVADTLFSLAESGSSFLPEGVDITAEQISAARRALGVEPDDLAGVTDATPAPAADRPSLPTGDDEPVAEP